MQDMTTGYTTTCDMTKALLCALGEGALQGGLKAQVFLVICTYKNTRQLRSQHPQHPLSVNRIILPGPILWPQKEANILV